MNMSGGVDRSDPVLVQEAAEGFEGVELAGHRFSGIGLGERSLKLVNGVWGDVIRSRN